jgi:hypothetical protein
MTVAGYKAWSGATTCGCFGKVAVPPIYTTIFDLICVCTLWVFCARGDAREPAPRHGKLRLIATAGWMLALGLGAGVLMIERSPSALAGDGELPAGSSLVVLDPETWAGKIFGLRRYIDIGPQLASGQWTVMLYHANCSHCRETIPVYARLAARTSRDREGAGVGSDHSLPDRSLTVAARSREQSGTTGPTRRFALVEMPEYGELDEPADLSACVRGKLSDQREWFAAAPVLVKLDNGRVVDAADGDAAVERVKRDLREIETTGAHR